MTTKTPSEPARYSEPMHHRNNNEKNHAISESTGKGEEQAGILSSATTGSETPRREPPSETESHANIDEGSNIIHTPHTTRCGVVPQLAGSIPLHTNKQAGTSGSAVVPGTQAETPVAVTPAMTAANSATTVAAVSDTTQAQIDACKQERRQVAAS